jgi:hypothetical protein
MAAAGRTWDPDTFSKMFAWMPLLDRGRHKNRRALSPRGSGAATLTTLSSSALVDISNNDALCATFTSATGKPLPNAPDLGDPGPSDLSEAALARRLRAGMMGPYYGASRNWASVSWGFYGSFLMFLETEFNAELRHPVFAFGYDWRRSCADSGSELAKFIANKVRDSAGAQDAVVVTHSMGGLVLRAAIQADSSVTDKVRGVIHGAQPSNGAVVCLRRFFTGCVSTLDGSSFEAGFLNNVMGNTPARFTYNLSGCTGPLQLLPNHVYQKGATSTDTPWLSVAGCDTLDLSDIYNLYRKYEWPGLLGPADAAQKDIATEAEQTENRVSAETVANINTAEQFHKSIETTAHANTLVVYSSGLATDVRLEFDAYPVNPPPGDGDVGRTWLAPIPLLNAGAVSKDPVLVVRKTEAGDGTVPAVSSKCPGLTLVRPAVLAGAAEHAKVYSVPQFQNEVRRMTKLLLGVPPGTSIGGG